jgi:hypothetical protein
MGRRSRVSILVVCLDNVFLFGLYGAPFIKPLTGPKEKGGAEREEKFEKRRRKTSSGL